MDDQLRDRIIALAFELSATPAILLDATGVVVAVNAGARQLLDLRSDAVGRRFQDLDVAARPFELGSLVEQAHAEGRAVELDGVSGLTPSGELTHLDVSVVPIHIEDQCVGLTITFFDVTRHGQVRPESEQSHRMLQLAYAELQSANEELEATNEELASTNAELETANRELQSTNEDLETMNAQLLSTNEELQAINDELRERTSEVNQVNAYIESVLSTLEASLIIVDRRVHVRVWNGLSFEMWGLRAEEVEGHDFLGLDLGFPVGHLAPPITACLQGEDPGEPVLVEARSRRGQPMICSARVAPLRGPEQAVEGAIILIAEERTAR
jgi:two-component system CheB/CheR fusion protein